MSKFCEARAKGIKATKKSHRLQLMYTWGQFFSPGWINLKKICGPHQEEEILTTPNLQSLDYFVQSYATSKKALL